jgi:two-component system, OmpR family, KDP operon response regulator KdpE
MSLVDRVLTHRTILKTIVMARLRNKIEPDPANPRYLLTEPFVGYRFVSAPASP